MKKHKAGRPIAGKLGAYLGNNTEWTVLQTHAQQLTWLKGVYYSVIDHKKCRKAVSQACKLFNNHHSNE